MKINQSPKISYREGVYYYSTTQGSDCPIGRNRLVDIGWKHLGFRLYSTVCAALALRTRQLAGI